MHGRRARLPLVTHGSRLGRRKSESGWLVERVVSLIRGTDINTVWKVKEQPWNKQSKSQSL